MRQILWITGAVAASLAILAAQQATDFSGIISKKAGQLPALAVPDFRGDAPSQPLMNTFNQTLWSDLSGAGIFNLVPKSYYPVNVPQQLSDFKPASSGYAPGNRGQSAPRAGGGGLTMADWAAPPAQANYVTIGYAANQNNLFVLRGWLVDLSIADLTNAAALAKTYIESPDEAGARKAAHEFAADILDKFGAKSLFGTHIYYQRRASMKSPDAQIWMMDFDGKNEKQLSHVNDIADFPAVSPDGSKLAFSSIPNQLIHVFSLDPVRDLRFYNQRGASVMAEPSFTPDGKQVVFMASLGGCCRIFAANVDGSNLRAITAGNSLDSEPKVNPKTGAEVLFSSGRSGPEQIYKMNMDGTDMERLTDGTGEASNPAWHPDGQFLAFAWTRGYMAGAFNIFVMNVARHDYQQLTHGEGKNENPSWAPDGKHIVFMSDRTGRPQIWTMLADGTDQRQLTNQEINSHPVWGK
jgi:TolB protein